jgi:hypothetical protein
MTRDRGHARRRARFRSAWARLPADEEAARDAFVRGLDDAQAAGDEAGSVRAAAGLLVAIAIEFADFRGLSRALPVFLRHDTGPDADGDESLALDLARLSLPLLDGSQPFGAASEAAAQRVHQVLRSGAPALEPEIRMLALKLLMDYRGQQLDVGRIEQLVALGHEWSATAGVSPAWQGRWWLLVLQNREWFGDAAGTAQALQQAQRLAQRHGLPRLRFELACVEMSAALKAADLPLADRLFRELDALRPAIRPGRLPHGLRAQALYMATRGEFAAALQRLDLLLAVCDDMEIPPRDAGPYHVLRADCLLALGRHAEGLALLEAQAQGQQGAQRALFDARIAVHRAAGVLDEPGETADALCRQALLACAGLRYSRFRARCRNWPLAWSSGAGSSASRPSSCATWSTSADSCPPIAPARTGPGGCAFVHSGPCRYGATNCPWRPAAPPRHSASRWICCACWPRTAVGRWRSAS